VAIANLQQAYRDGKLKERAVKQRILSDYFWTHIFNNPDIDEKTLTQLLPTIGGYVAEAEHTLCGMLNEQQNAFKYLWARWKYCKRDERLLWWFIFWDDFWAKNYDMECLADKAAKLGPSTPDSIMYNCMPKEELKKFLTNLGLYSDSYEEPNGCCGGSGGKLFFPSLLDKMYTAMEFSKGTFNRRLTKEAKETIAGGAFPAPDERGEVNTLVLALAGGPIPPPPPPPAWENWVPPPPPPPPPEDGIPPPPPPPNRPPPPPPDPEDGEEGGEGEEPPPPPPPPPPPGDMEQASSLEPGDDEDDAA
jgi:hypothetical protein